MKSMMSSLLENAPAGKVTSGLQAFAHSYSNAASNIANNLIN